MKEGGRKRVPPVIEIVRARLCDLVVRRAESMRDRLVFTFVEVVYSDKRRKAFECPVRGRFLAAGSDFLVMLDDDRYRVYDDSVRPLAEVPARAGTFGGCAANGFWLKRENGAVRMFDRLGRDVGGSVNGKAVR